MKCPIFCACELHLSVDTNSMISLRLYVSTIWLSLANLTDDIQGFVLIFFFNIFVRYHFLFTWEFSHAKKMIFLYLSSLFSFSFFFQPFSLPFFHFLILSFFSPSGDRSHRQDVLFVNIVCKTLIFEDIIFHIFVCLVERRNIYTYIHEEQMEMYSKIQENNIFLSFDLSFPHDLAHTLPLSLTSHFFNFNYSTWACYKGVSNSQYNKSLQWLAFHTNLFCRGSIKPFPKPKQDSFWSLRINQHCI